MKDLFTGSFGRLNNHGGSRMFTTPNTRSVTPEYEVSTDVPSAAKFVTCSLDGRLWVFQRSKRYYVAVFMWNEETEKLVFVRTIVLSEESVIKRGVDWILTDKSFIQALDNTPYFSVAPYSSDDTTYIDMINQSYSFFPDSETWAEIQNGQILRINGSPSNNWQEIQKNKIVSVEIHYYNNNDIQAITGFNVKLCYCNGKIYAKGKAHTGRAYLLPHILNTNGEPEDFYLYISPDYLRNYNTEKQTFDDNDNWDKLIIAQLNQDSVCVFTPENIDYGFCKKPKDSQVISLPQITQLDFSDNNGVIFFDGFTHSNLLVNNNGAFFLRDNLSYECKGLQQWLSPAGIVDAISPQFIMSSFDKATLTIHIQQNFHRELLTKKTLPTTSNSYSVGKLSLNDKNANKQKNIEVNTIPEIIYPSEYVKWEDIYRNPFEFSVILDKPYAFNWLSPFPISVRVGGYLTKIQNPMSGNHTVDRDNGVIEYFSPSTNSIVTIAYYPPNGDNELVNKWNNLYSKKTEYSSDGSTWQQTIPNMKSAAIKDNIVGLLVTLYSGRWTYSGSKQWVYCQKLYNVSETFLPLCNVPEEILDWQDSGNGLTLTDDKGYYIFTEPFSKTNFLVKRVEASSVRKTYHNLNSLQGNTYTDSIHLITSNRGNTTIISTKLHPEIFDFASEVERSKLF